MNWNLAEIKFYMVKTPIEILEILSSWLYVTITYYKKQWTYVHSWK